MANKIGMGDYVPDIYSCAKMHYDPIRRFCPPRICEVAYQMLTRLVLLASLNSLPQGRCADDQYVEKRRFAQGCA